MSALKQFLVAFAPGPASEQMPVQGWRPPPRIWSARRLGCQTKIMERGGDGENLCIQLLARFRASSAAKPGRKGVVKQPWLVDHLNLSAGFRNYRAIGKLQVQMRRHLCNSLAILNVVVKLSVIACPIMFAGS